MIFDTFVKYTKWGEMQGVSNAADLNEVVSKGNSDQLIMVSEAYQNEHLMEVAERIHADKKNIKIVFKNEDGTELTTIKYNLGNIKTISWDEVKFDNKIINENLFTKQNYEKKIETKKLL